ncbi:MAG: hypothetical protein ACMXYA_02085 [Candidatus Woesearchaeota archaeon]
MISKSRLIMGLSLAIFLFIVGCAPVEQVPQDDVTVIPEQQVPEQEMPGQQQTMDEVVAVVNGEEITSQEVMMAEQTFMQQGFEASQEEIIQQLIDQALLSQFVVENDLLVNTDEAEAELEFQLTQIGISLAEYREILEMQGVSYETELENIVVQFSVQQYIQESVDGSDFQVSQEEIQAVYLDYVANTPEEDVQPLEDLEDQIRSFLLQDQQEIIINEILEELRAEATIELS